MRVLGNCEHPNIVKLLDSGTLADGQMYYTMEYVPGADLEQVWKQLSKSHADADITTLAGSAFSSALQEASRNKRADVKTRYQRTMSPLLRRAELEADDAIQLPALPLPELPAAIGPAHDNAAYVRRVVELIRDAARALHTVHEQGVVHRDVSPGNMMLTPDGQRIVLMDFGLAKGGGGSQSVSVGAGFMGKLRYAAPEQLASAVLDVGPPADVRGLGATLWELVTRRRLFDEAGDERALATMIHQKDVPRLREIDPGFDRDLEAIVARATEREIDKRIASAEELADYLDLYLVGEALPIRPPTNRELVGRWVRRRKGLVALVICFNVLLSAVLGWAYWALDNKANEALQAQREAEQARADTEAVVDTLRQSFRNLFDSITTSEVFRGEGLYGPERELLTRLVAEFQAVIEETGFDIELQIGLATTRRRLAETNLAIAESSRSSAQSQSLSEEAAVQTRLAEQQANEALELLNNKNMPADRFDVRYERAILRKVLAQVYQNNGLYEEALVELDASIREIDDTLRVSLAISPEELLAAQAEALRLQGTLNLSLADDDPGNADLYLQRALEAFGTAETIQLIEFDPEDPDRVLASDLAAVKVSIAETLERMGDNDYAHIVYNSVINSVLGLFSVDAPERSRPTDHADAAAAGDRAAPGRGLPGSAAAGHRLRRSKG